MSSAVQIEDRRRRIALVSHDLTYERRNHTREKLEQLSLVVVWERESKDLARMSFDGLDGLVVVAVGMSSDARRRLTEAARTADVPVHYISARMAEWDDLRKWATRPFVLVGARGTSRVVDIAPPSVAPSSMPDPEACTETDLTALAESYATDAERARSDLHAAMSELTKARATVARLDRDNAALMAAAASAPSARDADTRRQAAEQKARTAEAEVADGRRELKKVRDALTKAEEERDEAESVAKQARKRPTPSNTDKVIAALRVLVDIGSMRADEARERVIEASK